MTLLNAIVSAILGAIIFGGFAYCWIESRRKDALDRRMRREIERAAHHAYTHAIQGRRDPA